MTKNLMKKALSQPVRKQHRSNFTRQGDIELALGWATGKVSLKQVAYAYGVPHANGGQLYLRLAQALRAHVQQQKV